MAPQPLLVERGVGMRNRNLLRTRPTTDPRTPMGPVGTEAGFEKVFELPWCLVGATVTSERGHRESGLATTDPNG